MPHRVDRATLPAHRVDEMLGRHLPSVHVRSHVIGKQVVLLAPERVIWMQLSALDQRYPIWNRHTIHASNLVVVGKTQKIIALLLVLKDAWPRLDPAIRFGRVGV